jgi:hypothetical protein
MLALDADQHVHRPVEFDDPFRWRAGPLVQAVRVLGHDRRGDAGVRQGGHREMTRVGLCMPGRPSYC